MNHWIWTLIVILVVIWYIVVTAIVTIRGGKDIRTMIQEWQKEK
ncbi:hypothetical protein [Membranihabitans marinus]|nr:hypothetical protein [Membranihabitans marinus]